MTATMTVEVPWLLFGGELLFDPVSRALLASTLVIWGLAAWSVARTTPADERRPGHFGFFGLVVAGNLVATAAGDPVTFFLGYALLGLCTYPLIAYDRTASALDSARLYLVYMLIGEGLLLAALVLSWSPPGGGTFPLHLDARWLALLVLGGLGVKAGIPGLHSWMPAAYRATPSAAASALAGATISVAILGTMRLGLFLPGTGVPSAAWVMLGGAGTLFGVVRGLTRSEPEHVLAYSSVSQMGIAITVLGGRLTGEGSDAAVLLAVTAFLAHHGLAKGSLFLGVGLVREGALARLPKAVVLGGLGIPALALAGLPLSSGSLAKTGLADATHVVDYLEPFLVVSSAATMVLMLHFLETVVASTEPSPRRAHASAAVGPWAASVVSVLLAVWLWPDFRPMARAALRPENMAHALWGPSIGALIWLAVTRTLQRGRKGPAGPSWVERGARVLTARWEGWLAHYRETRPALRQLPTSARRSLRHAAVDFEGAVGSLDRYVGTWTLTGTLFLILLLALSRLL
jgi:hydrogenase-4 component B